MIYSKEEQTHEAFVDRVLLQMQKQSINTPALALAMGQPESTIKNVLYKGTEPKRPFLIQLAAALGTTVEALSTGTVLAEDAETYAVPVHSIESLAVSQGMLKHAGTDNPASRLNMRNFPIPRAMLDRHAVNPEKSRLVVVNTDVMHPQISFGSFAFVDVDKTPLREGIFVIMIRNAVVIRRCTPVAIGFTLTCSNPEITGTTVAVDENNEIIDSSIQVVGRIFASLEVKNF